VRAYALDALRGLAILAMLLSGQLPFDKNALPSWMYHAQEPPPHFEWIGTLPGITWVDLVFPFFLFAMGASFPFALTRRMESHSSRWKLAAFIFERGFLLGFFALFVMAIRPHVMNAHPGTATWLLGLLGFLILFPILTRLPGTWPLAARLLVRGIGWAAAIAFFALAKYPDGSGFELSRSDIIIVVLANMAVFGSVAWLLTRRNLLLRIGLLGVLFAVRLSNLPQPADGWVHEDWTYTQHWWLSWICQLYYLQYLFIVIPGTIAGELILNWTRQIRSAGGVSGTKSWPLLRYVCVGALMLCLVVVLLAGLKARWLLGTTLLSFALCGIGWKLLQQPGNEIETLYQRLFQWAVYWLALGLVFEPYEGGIKKDHPTLSYYFIPAGLAICVYIAFSILIDVFQQRRWVRLLIDNGQNPMIAYAGINNFITPVLALTGLSAWLTAFATSPWRGFCKGAIITLLMGLTVSLFTRMKIYWRT
jgi:predicted acyltransferase